MYWLLLWQKLEVKILIFEHQGIAFLRTGIMYFLIFEIRTFMLFLWKFLKFENIYYVLLTSILIFKKYIWQLTHKSSNLNVSLSLSNFQILNNYYIKCLPWDICSIFWYLFHYNLRILECSFIITRKPNDIISWNLYYKVELSFSILRIWQILITKNYTFILFL